MSLFGYPGLSYLPTAQIQGCCVMVLDDGSASDIDDAHGDHHHDEDEDYECNHYYCYYCY